MPSGTDRNQSPPAAQRSHGTPPNLPKSVTWFRVQNPRTEKTSAPIMPSANIALLALSARVHKAIVQRQHWGSTMARGTVKWFNSEKGYGFIQPQAGGKDVFVHISAVEKAGLSSLNEGQVLEYEEVPNKGKTSAENLKIQR
jgi:CspA family cold shock protein